MKKLFLMIVFSICSMIVYAQELKDPTFRAPFTESSGNFLVLTSFDKIGKSAITIDYVKNLKQEVDDSKRQISDNQKQLKDADRTISDLKKQLKDADRTILDNQKQLNEQKRELENLKRSINQLTRQVEDLQKKVK
ncbi:MAG: hypothetical protein FWF09_08225 [Bacteroidales bacterium]|nr:hypothetical protein [Bacteroidales bacterium]